MADAQAVVYSLQEQEGYREVFACANQHRGYKLEVATGGGEPPCQFGCLPPSGTIALGGAVAAYSEDKVPSSKYGSCYCGEWHVVVRDLQTGRVVRRAPTGGSKLKRAPGTYTVPEPGDYVGVGPAVDIVVKADSSVAWITYNGLSALKKPPEYEVHVMDHLGSRIVASSADIGPSSLALAGSTLYWTQSGKPASAVLD